MDSSVCRCTCSTAKREDFKPIMHELPPPPPKKRKPRRKPLVEALASHNENDHTRDDHHNEEVLSATPVRVIETVGQSLGIALEKLMMELLMEDLASSS